MLTDTHTHLHFEQYAHDLAEVVERASASGVHKILSLGTDIPSSYRTIQLTKQFKNVYAAVGIHPTDILRTESENLFQIKELAASENKVVAIGEIGLDLFWKEVPLHKQLSVLEKMLEFADQLTLPVVIHNRDAHPEMRKFFEQHNIQSLKSVMHSFSGSEEDVQFYLSRGLYISFTGVITFKNFSRKQVVKSVPLDRLLLETDSPFLTPAPYRGKRNEPAFIKYIAEKLAEIHHTSFEEISQRTTANAAELFGW